MKFKFDDKKHRYNKICMISIEKGILISGRRGSKVWNQLMRENIQQVIRTLHDTELSFYCNDKWSFSSPPSQNIRTTNFWHRQKWHFMNAAITSARN